MSSPADNLHIKQKANEWISCLNRGLTDQEKPRLIAWINEDRLHHQAIYQCASLFDNISELNELNGIFPLEKRRVNFPLSNIKVLMATFVSLIAIFYFISVRYQWLSNGEKNYNTLSFVTDVGEIESVKLRDGSKITLNTDTKLVVNYDDNYRHITLLQGEAQFNVAKDKNRPFTVYSGSKSFTALGTTFNVQKNNASDMELIVSEGQVLVSEAQYSSDKLATFISKEIAKFDSKSIITTGEKSTIENNVQNPTLVLTPEQQGNYLAWQRGMLIFNGVSLDEALREVARYTNVQFEIDNPEVANIKISGYFRAGDVQGLMTSLSTNFHVNYKFNSTNSVQISQLNNS